MAKASNAGLQNFTILKSEAEAQANIFKDETQPLQKGKTFLKGKKIMATVVNFKYFHV